MKSSVLQCQAYQIVNGKTVQANLLDLVIQGYPKHKISDDIYIIGNFDMSSITPQPPQYLVSTQGRSGEECYDSFLKMYQIIPQMRDAIAQISECQKPIDYTY